MHYDTFMEHEMHYKAREKVLESDIRSDVFHSYFCSYIHTNWFVKCLFGEPNASGEKVYESHKDQTDFLWFIRKINFFKKSLFPKPHLQK